MFTSAAAAIADNVGEGKGGNVVKRPEGFDPGEPGGRSGAVLVVVLDIVISVLCSATYTPSLFLLAFSYAQYFQIYSNIF